VHSFVLQDWTTIRGGTGVTQITQHEPGWLDLEAYQDITLWLLVTEVTGTPTLTYQTSPTSDDSLFQAIATAITLTAATTPVVTSVLMLTAALAGTTPLARFVRWQLNGTPPWDATLRILVAANAPGM
jgi:hypothetical protein